MTYRPWMPSIAAATLVAAGCFDLRMPAQIDAGTIECDGGRYDPATGLCWQNPTNDQQYGWQEAIDYCAGLDLAGHDDWRLPDLDDFMTLLGGCTVGLESGSGGNCDSCPSSETCGALFGSDNYNGWSSYWSSSTCTAYPSCAWNVDFSSGYVGTRDTTMDMTGARCVRGGADVDTETDTGTETDTDISGLGEPCTQYGGECGEFEASVCVYDPMYPESGVCTVTGCGEVACPLGYYCCDCTGASYFFEDLCAPEDFISPLEMAGCTCE